MPLAICWFPRLPWFVSFLAKRMVWALVTLFLFLTAVFFFMQVWVPYSWATLQSMGSPTLEADIRAIPGVAGVHVMAYRREHLVSEIIAASGVLEARDSSS